MVIIIIIIIIRNCYCGYVYWLLIVFLFGEGGGEVVLGEGGGDLIVNVFYGSIFLREILIVVFVIFMY